MYSLHSIVSEQERKQCVTETEKYAYFSLFFLNEKEVNSILWKVLDLLSFEKLNYLSRYESIEYIDC